MGLGGCQKLKLWVRTLPECRRACVEHLLCPLAGYGWRHVLCPPAKCVRGGEKHVWGRPPKRTFRSHAYISRLFCKLIIGWSQKRLWTSSSPLRPVTVAVTTHLKPRDRIVSTHYAVIVPKTVDTIRSRGAAQVQGARRVPQHYGADWGIRSRLGSLTPKSHRYASLAGSLWLSRLANPNRLLDHLHGIALGFRNLQNYIHHSLPHTRGLKHHPLPVL